jgi:hypothetical protein
MKMDYIGMRLFEDVEEIPRGIVQVPAHVRLYGEAFRSHPFPERAKSRHRIDARVVALLSLHTAHLRDERFSAAYLHAVNEVRNLHTGCPDLRQRGTGLASVPDLDDSKQLERLHQCIPFIIRSVMYSPITSKIAKPLA